MYSTNTRQASMSPSELRQRLAELGMKQVDLAALVGVHESTVRRWCAEDGTTASSPAPPYVRVVLDLHARKKPAADLFRGS